jgi:hypothetical protein
MLPLFLIQLAFVHFSIAATTDFISETQNSEWISIYSEFQELKFQSSNFRNLKSIGVEFEIFMKNTEAFFSNHHLAGVASLEHHSNDFGLVYFFLPFVACQRMLPWDYYYLPYLIEKDSKGMKDIMARFDVMNKVILYMNSIKELDVLRILIRICEKLLQNDRGIYDDTFLAKVLERKKKNLLRLEYESFLVVSPADRLTDLYLNISYLIKLKNRHSLLLDHFIRDIKNHITNHFSLYSNSNLNFLLDKDPKLIVIVINCMGARRREVLAIFNAFFGHPKDPSTTLGYTRKAQRVLKMHLQQRNTAYLRSIIKKVDLYSNNK